MAASVGTNFVLPKAWDVWGQLTGSGRGWFGTDPTGTAANTIDWGNLGGWTPYGPRSTTYQAPNSFQAPLGDPNGVGMIGALFGGGQFGQGAYGRFQNAGQDWNNRYQLPAFN